MAGAQDEDPMKKFDRLRRNQEAADQMQQQQTPQGGGGDAYSQLGGVLRQRAEIAKEAASRRLNQQFGGRLKSGAVAMLGQQAASDIESGLQGQLANIGMEKAAKAREERLIGQAQKFQAGEAEKQRAFVSKERMGTQEFQAGQSALDRQLQKMGIDIQASALNEQARQFNQEFAENAKTNLFNKISALAQMDESTMKDLADSLGVPLTRMVGGKKLTTNYREFVNERLGIRR